MPTTTYSDSRELLAELRDLLEDPSYDYDAEPDDRDDEGEATYPAYFELPGDDQARVEMLRDALREMPETTVDSERGNSWGCAMVPETEFEDHAREYAEDIGAIDHDGHWPTTHIDWEAAADALKQDYASVEIDGVTYLCR